VFTLLLILAQTPVPRADSIIAAVRAAAEREPVEAMGGLHPTVSVKDVRLLDIDGDGKPEAFVWIQPAARQTPTILVYTYDARHGAHRLLEALVPGRLQPAAGGLVDDHTLGVGMDFGAGADTQPGAFEGLAATLADSGVSLVRFATFLHTDTRHGFVDYVDLSDRALPRDTKTCDDIRFSPVEAIAAGTVPGMGALPFLVALTDSDITTYRFRGIRPNGRLVKETAIQPRPADVTGLATSAEGEVRLVRGGVPTAPAAPAARPVIEREPALGTLHIMDPAHGMIKRAATDSIIAAQIADAAREYRAYAPIPRGAFFDLAWPKDTVEYRRMAGYGLVLVTAVDQSAAELPIARAYVQAGDGRDSTLTLLGSIVSEIPAGDTLARAVFGRYRFDGLYLVPLAPQWRGGVIVIDFIHGRKGFRVGQIAGATPRELAQATRTLAARPDSNAIVVMIRREDPDFVVTK
jgi:hypothetical protein